MILKKKIIIFTSGGGRGHISATEALKQYLGSAYQIEQNFIFNDPLKSLDPLSVLSRGKYVGEDVYNWLLRGKWYALINVFAYWFGRFYYTVGHKQVVSLLTSFLTQKQPDLIISVVPFINGPLLATAEHLNIPLIVIPTDLDSTTFILGINKPTYAKFRYCVAFNDSNIKKTIEPAHIPNALITTTGFPIRRDFFEKKNPEAIKALHNIPANKAIILIMLGGIGSSELIPLVKKIATVAQPLHLLVCIGKSEHLRAPLLTIALPTHLTITIISFTHRISDFMAIADLLITKSGSVSVCEALYMNVPIILDATSAVLTWEKLNHLLINKYHVGFVMKSLAEIPHLITRVLNNNDTAKEMRLNNTKIDKKNIKYTMRSLVHQLLK